MAVKISILILLYNCEIKNSKTISSIKILDNLKNRASINIDIINNGPRFIDYNSEEFLFKTNVIQHIQNYSLSVIYNNFIARHDSDYYIIFDHDTHISGSYLDLITSIMNSRDSYLGLPNVFYKNKQYYPVKILNYKFKKNIRSIASGMVISKKLKELYIEKFCNVFDDRFYFYGVDSTFFFRFNKMNQSSKVIIKGEICHCLSRLDNNDEQPPFFRNIERSYDLGLTVRYYPSCIKYLKLIYFIFTNPFNIGKYRNLSFIQVVRAFFSGVHYKNK